MPYTNYIVWIQILPHYFTRCGLLADLPQGEIPQVLVKCAYVPVVRSLVGGQVSRKEADVKSGRSITSLCLPPFLATMAISAIVVFFSLQVSEIEPARWGSTVVSKGCDGTWGCTFKTLREGEYFGPRIGESS